MGAMTNLDKLHDELQGLVDDHTCDYHFIQEIGIGGCPTADASVSELLIKSIGDAVRSIPSVYLGWFANSQGDGGTARKTTWLFEENEATIGQAYKEMCGSLETPQPSRCKVGSTVKCPGSSVASCQGDQCCPDGSTCPSASQEFKGCPKGKVEDCTRGDEVEMVLV
jgi:hypothetical protein